MVLAHQASKIAVIRVGVERDVPGTRIEHASRRGPRSELLIDANQLGNMVVNRRNITSAGPQVATLAQLFCHPGMSGQQRHFLRERLRIAMPEQ